MCKGRDAVSSCPVLLLAVTLQRAQVSSPTHAALGDWSYWGELLALHWLPGHAVGWDQSWELWAHPQDKCSSIRPGSAHGQPRGRQLLL